MNINKSTIIIFSVGVVQFWFTIMLIMFARSFDFSEGEQAAYTFAGIALILFIVMAGIKLALNKEKEEAA